MGKMQGKEMKILFNFASRSRPEKFRKVCANLMEMCESDNYQILAKIDYNDKRRNEYLHRFNGPMDKIIFKEGKSQSKIHAINRDIPQDGWDILVDVSDDFVFIKKGFDNIIRQHCGPDDCLHFPEPFATKENIKTPDNNIIIMACMGREYYQRFGYIFNPQYVSLFCDNELTEVAKKSGRYKFVNEDIFYHAHPSAGYGLPDKQTRFTENFWPIDKTTYDLRKLKGFPV